MTLHVAVGSHCHKSMDPSRYTLRASAAGGAHQSAPVAKFIQVSEFLYVSALSSGDG